MVRISGFARAEGQHSQVADTLHSRLRSRTLLHIAVVEVAVDSPAVVEGLPICLKHVLIVVGRHIDKRTLSDRGHEILIRITTTAARRFRRRLIPL